MFYSKKFFFQLIHTEISKILTVLSSPQLAKWKPSKFGRNSSLLTVK